MKTAREQLFDEVTGLLPTPPTDASPGEMKKIMAKYRVQTKPGVEIPAGVTARDALGDRVLELWRAGGDDEATRTRMGTLIDEFRMQLKQAGPEGAAPAAAKPAPRPRPVPAAPAPRAEKPDVRPTLAPPARKPGAAAIAAVAEKPLPRPTPAAASASAPLGIGEPPARGMRHVAEPVAGGPRRRQKARGECPKCKSLGVVLARSYSGDEYYSCIYCGWQAYKPADDDDPNASLAVRLLGQTLGSD
jgi:hypothetical protein